MKTSVDTGKKNENGRLEHWLHLAWLDVKLSEIIYDDESPELMKEFE